MKAKIRITIHYLQRVLPRGPAVKGVERPMTGLLGGVLGERRPGLDGPAARLPGGPLQHVHQAAVAEKLRRGRDRVRGVVDRAVRQALQSRNGVTERNENESRAKGAKDTELR